MHKSNSIDVYARENAKSKFAWTIAFIFAFIWVIIAFIPFIFMILNSFKDQFEMLSKGVFQLPDSLNLSNYKEVLEKGIFGFFLRSVIVLTVSLSILLFIVSCAAYPFSRMKFKLRIVLFALVVAAMSVPIHVTLIPVFKLTTRIGLYDTIWSLVGPYVAFAVPLSTFILTTFMKSIPAEIEESAEIDGCGKYRNFFQIILPLSKSGLSTLAIYNGVYIWNEFAFANTLTQSVNSKTLPLALSQFKGEYSMNAPLMMAVLTLSVFPMIVLFIFFQDKLVKGMMVGAVKG